jgi:hypothetical protein
MRVEIGGGGVDYINLDYTSNVVGSPVVVSIPGGAVIVAGQTIKIFTGDLSTGGTIDYALTVSIVEFDA